MPLSSDFVKLRKAMRSKYGKEKGDEVFWSYVNKHKLDEKKPMPEHLSAIAAVLDSDADSGIAEAQEEPFQQEDHGQPATLGQPGDIPGIVPQPTPTGDPTKPQGLGEAMGGTDRPITLAPGANDTTIPQTMAPVKDTEHQSEAYGPVDTRVDSVPHGQGETPTAEATGVPTNGPYKPQEDEKMQETAKLQASSAKGSFFSIPAYHFTYSAAPINGSSSELGVKAIVLEEGPNVNEWEIPKAEFPRVAAQYASGKPQLRVDHSKDVSKVIGRATNGLVLKGSEVPAFLGGGKTIDGIDPEGLFVGAEFVADPQDPQVRTNILNGYVVTGSIGVDAEAFCKECDTPLKAVDGEMKRQCSHYDAGIYLQNVDVKEWSYVAEPAFDHTQGFAASVTEFVSKELKEKTRDKMEKEEFAYPEGRKLPIQDAAHVRNAMSRFNQTDLPSGERSKVKARICRAAKKFGIESDFCKGKSKSKAEAMADAYIAGVLSSSKYTPTATIQMSSATVSAEAAKKPPVKDEDEDMDADARAEKLLAMYKRGMADAAKFRAESEGKAEGEAKAESEAEGEAKADAEGESDAEGEADAESESESEGEADAKVNTSVPEHDVSLPGQKPKVGAKFSRKTDQISKSGRVAPKAAKFSLMEKVNSPTKYLLATHPEYRELFRAFAEAPAKGDVNEGAIRQARMTAKLALEL